MKPSNPAPVVDSVVRARFQAAVDAFVDKVRGDPQIVAVVVGGSLAYDVVWEKSDLDLTVVVRDQPLATRGYTLTDDGIALNVALTTRSEFRRRLDRNVGGSWDQAYLAKGVMVHTVDESLREAFDDARRIGADDMAYSMMTMACMVLGNLEKAQKWLVARRDPNYAQYFLSMCAEPVANMELVLRGEPASRASLQKALQVSPELMRRVYLDPMSRLYGEAEVEGAIAALEAYLDSHLDVIAKPVLAFLSDGEVKTGTLIRKHFDEDPHFLVHVFDWLAEKGVIEKVAQTIRITPKGRQVFEEVGYLYVAH